MGVVNIPLGGGGGGLLTASNGLAAVGTDVRWGGTLTQDTIINGSDNELWIQGIGFMYLQSEFGTTIESSSGITLDDPFEIALNCPQLTAGFEANPAVPNERDPITVVGRTVNNRLVPIAGANGQQLVFYGGMARYGYAPQIFTGNLNGTLVTATDSTEYTISDGFVYAPAVAARGRKISYVAANNAILSVRLDAAAIGNITFIIENTTAATSQTVLAITALSGAGRYTGNVNITFAALDEVRLRVYANSQVAEAVYDYSLALRSI